MVSNKEKWTWADYIMCRTNDRFTTKTTECQPRNYRIKEENLFEK